MSAFFSGPTIYIINMCCNIYVFSYIYETDDAEQLYFIHFEL